MSGDPPTEGGPDDPFEGLEGLEGFEGLEDLAGLAGLEGLEGFEGLEDLAGLGDLAGFGDPGEEPEPPEPGRIGGLGDIPVIGDLMRMLQGATPGASHARDVARAIACGGVSEPNIDPPSRMAIEQLVRVAELRVADATGLQPSPGAALRVEVVNRAGWSDRTVSDYDELFGALSKSMTATMEPDLDDDPMAAMMAGLTRMIGPTMLALTTGAMVGRLAQYALGGYVLPVPRPPGNPMLIALPNVDEFGKEWSLDPDDLRLWVCLHEAVYCAVFGVDHVRRAVSEGLVRHASAFESNPRRIEELLGDFDPVSAGPEAFAALQSQLGSPEALLGAVRSPTQEALLPQMTALVAAITGYVDHTMDRIGADLIGSYDRLSEALRRHRVEASASDRLVERLLGLELDQAQYERGAAFAAGVVERAGPEGLRRLFSHPDNLPTPAEVDAAGLWLARIDLPR